MNDASASFRRRGLLVIFLGFALLILAGGSAALMEQSSEQAARATRFSRQVRETQAALFALVQDAETAQRGYLLTGDPSYLDPFYQARYALPRKEAELAQKITDEPQQQQRLSRLETDIDLKIQELNRTIVLRKSGDEAAALALVRNNQGRDLMVRIRAQSTAFDRAEAWVYFARQANVTRQRLVLMSVIVAALVIAGLLAYGVWAEVARFIRDLDDRNQALRVEAGERQRAEAQLRQAQKMEALGQLTGGVAHDFNNMLAIIVGNLDIMIRRLGDQHERIRPLAENALVGANRAAALTKRLLAFSRLQALDPRPIDVNKCVSDMSEMLRRVLGEHIAVETVLAGGLWRAFVDAPQLESAILNLSVNARDAMPGGGRLTIETANASLDHAYAAQNDEVESGQYVMIAIADTGTGMTPEVMERAFDPFFTTKKLGEGTGLGLSQVHGFLKQSKGHVKLYSEMGVGTNVKLYFPRDFSGAPLADAVRAPPVATDNSRFTVLIVEDDPGVRSFAVSAARELGFGVIEADNAAVALERLRVCPEISVLLTDVIMPGITGRQLADQALTIRPDLPVVFMTGYTRNAIVHNGTLDPGTRLITKPFTLADLDRELNNAVASLGL